MTMLSILLAAALPWENPDVNAINRLPARGESVPCPTEELAFAIARGEKTKEDSPWIQSLNGAWDFQWKRTPTNAWEKSARVAVPGCWQLQGAFDPPLYTNVRYPFRKDAPQVMRAPEDPAWTAAAYRNPVGLYRTTFKTPFKWHLRRTTLHFGGVSSAFYVRLNGKEIGYSEDSRLPAEFDLTPHLKWFGPNTLEVEVYKHSDGSYLEDQDFWRLSGIFREVYLVSEGRKAPRDLIVETTLADDYSSGTFAIRDEKGNVLKKRDVPGVRLWSCEHPDLYVTPIESTWGWWKFGGTDYRAVSIGFRKVEIRDSVLYVNGKRALIKGANRHEMEPATGYAVTSEGMRRDIALMRAFNVNAVRTCHYPNVEEWYRLCDREGIMVCCEANVESHGYGYGKESLAHSAAFRKSFVERGTRMVETFRNHPSVIYWSLGNESGDGENPAAEFKAVRALDPTRPIHYERAIDGDNTEIYAEMYQPPKAVEKYVANRPKKPYVLCEYTHAMGNSNGGVGEYWDLVRTYPSMQGGFVWDFADQAVWKTDARGTWLSYGGDWGDLPNDDNFNCNGFFDALRNPHPGAYEIKHAYRNILCESFDFATGRVKIRNEFLFTDLSDYDCYWRSFRADGSPAAKGSIDLGRQAPGSVVEYALKDFAGDSVVFTFDGFEGKCAWDGFARPFAPKTVAERGVPCSGKRFKMNFWRAPTDNDRGWNMPTVCKVWKDATATQTLPKGVTSDLKTSILSDGSTLVDWTLTVPKGLPPLPRVGLTFEVPKAKDEVAWYGRGPWENYADRNRSAMLGVYKARVGLVSGLADPATGTIAYPADRLNPDNYIEPGEQGYRTDCRVLEAGDVRVTAVNAPFGFNVWPYAQTMLEGKKHQWELKEGPTFTVNVDAVQMGVGGDDSWGARPHEPYMPGAGTYRLVFIVSPRAGATSLSATGDYRLPVRARTVASAAGYNSWPQIANAGDRLVCVYSRGSAHSIDEGRRDTYAKHSTDGGRNWSGEVVVANDPKTGEVAEGRGVDATGAALFWVRCWGGGARHELYRTADGEKFEKIATVRPEPMPMQITDIVRVGGLGLAAPYFAGNYRKGGANSWGLLVSADEGKTWTMRPIEENLSVKEWVTEPSLVDLGGGRLLIVGRCEQGLGTQFQVTSEDGGKTWKKARTNIADVAESTPSLVYDAATGLVANYYYERGARLLKRRVAKAADVFADATAWPAPEILDEGFEARAYDAGNVNVARRNGIDCCAWYTGTPSNATVVVTGVAQP